MLPHLQFGGWTGQGDQPYLHISHPSPLSGSAIELPLSMKRTNKYTLPLSHTASCGSREHIESECDEILEKCQRGKKESRKKKNQQGDLAVPLDRFCHVFLTARLFLQTVPVVLGSQRGRFATREEEEGLRCVLVK